MSNKVYPKKSPQWVGFPYSRGLLREVEHLAGDSSILALPKYGSGFAPMGSDATGNRMQINISSFLPTSSVQSILYL